MPSLMDMMREEAALSGRENVHLETCGECRAIGPCAEYRRLWREHDTLLDEMSLATVVYSDMLLGAPLD